MSEMVNIKSPSGDFNAYFTKPAHSHAPAVVLLHEIWGLNEHTKDVAERLQKEGYAVLAPDLLSNTGITNAIDQSIMKELADPATRDEAQKKMRATTAPLLSPEFGAQTVAKLKAAFEHLSQQPFVQKNRIGVMGFCLGGTYAYALAVAEPGLAFCIPFYGHAPQPMDSVSQISCPVLAFYGRNDEPLMHELVELERKMGKYKKRFAFHTYPNAGHAFFNNTNPVTYRKEAASDAWQRVMRFLKPPKSK